MVEKCVQTYVRAPNGDLYCVDDEGQAFRSVNGPSEPAQNASAQSCHALPDLPGPEGANILPDGMGANIVPDQMAADTAPNGVGANIVPDGIGQQIRP